MTTDERIENLEKVLASARRFNRGLPTCTAVCLGLIFAWVFFAQPSQLGTAQAEGPANPYEAENTKLQAEVNLLKRENERLRKELDEAKKEKSAAAPTEAQGQSAPQPAAASPPEVPPGGCLYRGKPRTSQWVDVQFAKFRDKIAKIDGQWRDCGKGFLNPAEVGLVLPAPGTEIRSAPIHSQVFRIMNATEILAIRPFVPGRPAGRMAFQEGRTRGFQYYDAVPDLPEIIFHIRGIKSQGLTDGTQLIRFGFHYHASSTSEAAWSVVGANSAPEEWLVYCGTYTYRGPDDSRRTVPSYAIYRPATREEFVEACASGLTLTDYVTDTKAITNGPMFKPVP